MEFAANASPTDFDFMIGKWQVRHRRLNQRLAGCHEWTEFKGESATQIVLGGFGNVEDNYLDLPDGAYRAVALRSYNPSTRQWSIWWLDGRSPESLDVPVVGQFTNRTGIFYANDQLNGKPIKVRFTWHASNPDSPRWEQAFSDDDGKTWETNWTMDFTRLSL